MKIFLLDDPMRPADYAMFSATGTWSKSAGVCPNCGDPSQSKIEPLRIEWEPGTETIGDFSWCGYTCVILDKVRDFLGDNAYECKFGEVEVLSLDKHTRSKRPRVRYPYHGPHLSWLMPTRRVELDAANSKVSLKTDCHVCKRKHYTFKREEIHIAKNQLCGAKMFLVDQFGRSDATFVTEQALLELTAMNFSNLCPKLAGEVY
jgi:hypothetical protein